MLPSNTLGSHLCVQLLNERFHTKDGKIPGAGHESPGLIIFHYENLKG